MFAQSVKSRGVAFALCAPLTQTLTNNLIIIQMPKQLITIERIDKALATVAELIITFPDLDLWPYFEYLDEKREGFINRDKRLQAALDRVKETNLE